MFNLADTDLNSSIISFGDGPASFNYELKKRTHVTSVDPIYQFSKDEIEKRINETKSKILEQVEYNKSNYLWQNISDIKHLETVRLDAMNKFLNDFEEGKIQNRYIPHALPDKLNFPDQFFDIGLSSHFLLLYGQLGLEFHIAAINEMLRLANEVRIFPIIDLNTNKTELLYKLINHYQKKFSVEIVKTSYRFQKNAFEMLLIRNE
jgi:hypothetical protein